MSRSGLEARVWETSRQNGYTIPTDATSGHVPNLPVMSLRRHVGRCLALRVAEGISRGVCRGIYPRVYPRVTPRETRREAGRETRRETGGDRDRETGKDAGAVGRE